MQRFIGWLGIAASKFHDWRTRYGLANEHNALVPRDWWLEPWEKAAILEFHQAHPLEGYRRLAFMMLDADVVAASPSSVYRVLCQAGAIKPRNTSPRSRGRAFNNPCAPTSTGTSMSPTSTSPARSSTSAASRRLQPLHRPLGDPREHDRGRRRDDHPAGPRALPRRAPRIISDNGPQFIAKDFKEFIRICGMTHVRTSPYYPQSNGKMERWYKTLKGECIRVKTPLSLADARRIVEDFVAHYYTVRLHSTIGYVAPADKLAGRDRPIFTERDRKLDAARERRKASRAASRAGAATDPGQPMGGPWNERGPSGG